MSQFDKYLTCPESFLLFSQDLPSQNLGFVDPKATCVEISVAGKDYSIHQSPTLLSSDRAGGTTGAGEYLLGVGSRMCCC